MVKIEQKLGPDEFAKSLHKYGQFNQLNVDGLKTADLLKDPRTGKNRTLYSLRHMYATLLIAI